MPFAHCAGGSDPVLAFMTARRGEALPRVGLESAAEAYVTAVTPDVRRARYRKMLKQAQWHCRGTDGLNVTDAHTLVEGLRDFLNRL